MRFLRTQILMGAVCTLAIFPGTAGAAGPHWSIASTPKVAAGGGDLSAVIMTKHHGFAVGSQSAAGQPSQPLIERFSSGTWRRQSLPTLSGGGALSGVDGTDSNAWAVGGTSGQGLVEHWNGHAWKRITVPRVSEGALNGVSVHSGSDAWAVGSMTKKFIAVPWVLHWNGVKWSTVAIPNPGHLLKGFGRTAFLYGVAAEGSHVYAVGTADSRGRGSGRAVAEMYAGGRWHVMTLPSLPGGVSALGSVAGTASNNIWAVGSVYSGSPHTLALHWNGKIWHRVTTPDPGAGELGAVSASSAQSIWAVGDYTASNGWSRPLTEHWNGSNWSRATAPAAPIGSFHGCTGLGDGYQGLTAVSVVPGSSQAWAVGYHDRLTCHSVRLPLVEHYR